MNRNVSSEMTPVQRRTVFAVKAALIIGMIILWAIFSPQREPTARIFTIGENPMLPQVHDVNGWSGENAAVYPASIGPAPTDVFHVDPRIPRREEVAGDAHPTGRPNGVIMFLYGGTKGIDYFFDYTLPSLERNVLSCAHYKYPIRIFYEEMPDHIKATIISKVPSASEVIFENVAHLWEKLPHNITEDQVKGWIKGIKKGRNRGYRFMCRFWAGMVWQLPSMQQYDYYWRLDTDSFVGEATVDPFVVMQQRQCEYGFNNVMNEDPAYTYGMYEIFNQWAATSPDAPTPERVSEVNRLLTPYSAQQPIIPQFFNNFELGTVRFKASREYQSFFRYVDETEPFGIFRHRWGDAPIHTYGVFAILGVSSEKICFFSENMIKYEHEIPAGELPPIAGCKRK